MAAVVASLAAFLAGCGLPALPVGDSDRGRSLCSEDNSLQDDRPSSAAWQSACEAVADMGITSSPSPAASGDPHRIKVLAPADEKSMQAFMQPSLGSVRRPRMGEPHRRVTFNLGRSTFHEITPYSEVYGMHPRDFNFKRSTEKSSTLCTAEVIRPKASIMCWESSDSDDEDDEELRSHRDKALSLLSSRSSGFRFDNPAISRPCSLIIGGSCLMLRMFGIQVCLQLLSEALSLPKEAIWGFYSS